MLFKIDKIKHSFYIWLWKKIVFFAFPTWDYSYLFEMLHLYLKKMSSDYEQFGHTVNSEKYAKDQLIASEYARYINEGMAYENAFYNAPEIKMWSEPWEEDEDLLQLHFDNPESAKKTRKRWDTENYLSKFYKDEFFKILSKHVYSWWD